MQPTILSIKTTPTDPRITGLTYVQDFITKEEEVELIKNITKGQWNTTLKRRTQHYGFQYQYGKKNEVKEADPIPQWACEVKGRIQRFVDLKLTQQGTKQQALQIEYAPTQFDQLIINEYIPGQGINPHTDNPTLFSTPIVSLSLGSQCIMEFDNQNKLPDQETIELRLKRRSIFILDGEARYEWKHSIPARKKDQGRVRAVRFSLTFRVMKGIGV